MLKTSQIDAIITRHRILLLDGGLATELETQGYDLNHPLWSARLLLSHPDAIRDAHRRYLEAGSMCITSASYQASMEGLTAAGLSKSDAARVLMDSVAIARQAVAEFNEASDRAAIADRPIVAASIGPYGAFLADGSEYRGHYAISRNQLNDFHAERLQLISQAQPDLLACETIPSLQEAEVLRDLLIDIRGALAWISFSCRDGKRISDGHWLQDCAAMFADVDCVFAVGVNCTAPKHVHSLIGEVHDGAPGKRIVVYPNSGQHYSSGSRSWTGQSSAADFGQLAKTWFQAGATLIGGCCQTGPSHIRAIRQAIAG